MIASERVEELRSLTDDHDGRAGTGDEIGRRALRLFRRDCQHRALVAIDLVWNTGAFLT